MKNNLQVVPTSNLEKENFLENLFKIAYELKRSGLQNEYEILDRAIEEIVYLRYSVVSCQTNSN